jgi:hypothetical protein
MYSKIDLISLGIHIHISHSLVFSNTFTVYTKEEEENHSKQYKHAAREKKIRIIRIKCSTERNVKMFIMKENSLNE